MSKVFDNGFSSLHHTDARCLPLEDESVHCVVTSPPYWGLRDYGIENGIGDEASFLEHVDNMVAVGSEIWRVLRDDGVFWLNYGDAYSSGSGRVRMSGDVPGDLNGMARKAGSGGLGLRPKNLMGMPWRIAFALQDDGWILRSAIFWHKPNPMPESIRDRPTTAYELIFLFVKSGKYFYDGDAIRTKLVYQNDPGASWDAIAGFKDGARAGDDVHTKVGLSHQRKRYPNRQINGIRAEHHAHTPEHLARGANAHNVWVIPLQGRSDAHFATFPDELPRRCILAGTSAKGVCSNCGSQWVRDVSVSYVNPGNRRTNGPKSVERGHESISLSVRREKRVELLGWSPSCDCDADVVPATVLDPFVGSGTTVAVAQSLARRGVGCDLNADYLEIAAERITQVPYPMVMQ